MMTIFIDREKGMPEMNFIIDSIAVVFMIVSLF